MGFDLIVVNQFAHMRNFNFTLTRDVQFNLIKAVDVPLMRDNNFTHMMPETEIYNIVRVIVYYLKKLLMTPHLDSHNTTAPILEILLAVQTRNRI